MEGRTAFICAIESHSYGMAATLLEAGSDPSSQDASGKGLVDYFDLYTGNQHYYWHVDSHQSVLTFLAKPVDSGASLNMQNARGQTLLHLFGGRYMSERTLKFMKFILENGSDPSLSDLDGKKAIHCLLLNPYPCALTLRHVEFHDILVQLIHGSGDINSSSGSLGTPLHFMVRFFFETYCSDISIQALELFVEGGAELSRTNGASETPAIMAMQLMGSYPMKRSVKKCVEMMEILISPGRKPRSSG
jgi:ankyrin repeat protein